MKNGLVGKVVYVSRKREGSPDWTNYDEVYFGFCKKETATEFELIDVIESYPQSREYTDEYSPYESFNKYDCRIKKINIINKTLEEYREGLIQDQRKGHCNICFGTNLPEWWNKKKHSKSKGRKNKNGKLRK